MQWKHLLITAATIAIIYLLVISGRSSNIAISWRGVLHKSSSIMGPYQAPLMCDGPIESRVPESYIVCLHSGWTLDQHKEAIGEAVDLDSAIDDVSPETQSHGTYYRAKLDDAALAAVRADMGVDVVECNMKIDPPDDENVGEDFEDGDL